MTLRDWFAGQALAGVIADAATFEAVNGGEIGNRANVLAAVSYRIADAMLAAREGAK